MVTRKVRSDAVAIAAGDSNNLREFRKTNEAIGLRVVEGSLSLLSRKVFNVMIFHAQNMQETGINAPIDTPASRKYFWIPLAKLARDAAYDSKDTQNLKEVLEEMQNIKLKLENGRQWTSERLVSSVTLVNPEGFHKNSGQVWLGYAFPPEVHEQVMAPSTFTRLSIVYQSSLKSGSALALYEICRRYATNPSKLTFVQTVEHWHGLITGNPLSADSAPVYKYFKRDTLKPAMAEVNQLTDITIELIEHKNGRRVEKLQFKVELVKQTPLLFPVPPIIDDQLLQRVIDLGFSKADASDLVAQYSDEQLRLAIERVEARSRAVGMSPLTAPAGYFRWVLQDLAKNPPSAAQTPQAPPTASPARKSSAPSVMEKFLAGRAQEALAVHKELDERERRLVFEAFRAQTESETLKLDRGLDSTMVRVLFSQWYAKELWGPPTAEALASFIEKSGA